MSAFDVTIWYKREWITLPKVEEFEKQQSFESDFITANYYYWMLLSSCAISPNADAAACLTTLPS